MVRFVTAEMFFLIIIQFIYEKFCYNRDMDLMNKLYFFSISLYQFSALTMS